MKKIIILACAAAIMFSTTACSKKEPEPVVIPIPSQIATIPTVPQETQHEELIVDKQALYEDIITNGKYTFFGESFEVKSITMNVSYIVKDNDISYSLTSPDNAVNHYGFTRFTQGNESYLSIETPAETSCYKIIVDEGITNEDHSLVYDIVQSIPEIVTRVLEEATQKNIKYVETTADGDIIDINTQDTKEVSGAQVVHVFQFTCDPDTHTIKKMKAVWKAENSQEIDSFVRFISDDEVKLNHAIPVPVSNTLKTHDIFPLESEIFNAISQDKNMEITGPEISITEKQRFWDNVFMREEYIIDNSQMSLMIGEDISLDVLYDDKGNAICHATNTTQNLKYSIYYAASHDKYFVHEVSPEMDAWYFCIGGFLDNNKVLLEDIFIVEDMLGQMSLLEYIETINGVDHLTFPGSFFTSITEEPVDGADVFINPVTLKVEKLSFNLRDTTWTLEFPETESLDDQLTAIEPYIQDVYNNMPLDIGEIQTKIQSIIPIITPYY